ncbi:MAG: hypothetical protein LC659_00175 [Myxococcales bacterium]|nr:hypothetical protein [Myxococcales bacterium]
MAKKRAGRGGDDEILEALYAAPPRAFVAERKRAVAALEAAGRDEDARAVAKLKRPSASIWAVNQLARRAPDAVMELLELGATLRAEERKLMRGGSADGFMSDARTARQKVASLSRRAEAFVEEAGHKATPTLGRKIAQTLHAASIADDDTRARLQAGRLQDDLAAPSAFGTAGDLATTLAASLGAARAQKRAAGTHTPAAAHKQAAAQRSAAARRTHAAAERQQAAAGREQAGPRRKPVAAERADARNNAVDKRKDAAAERKQAVAERKRAAAALRHQRRAQAAARKHAAAMERAAVAAARVVAERTRAVDKARDAVEQAESQLRTAKDALVDAESAAAAARRAADEAAAAAR